MEKETKQKKILEKGFTLMEVLIVVAIIGILASIVLLNVNIAREKAKISKAKADERSIINAIILFESDTGEWPGHKETWEIQPGAADNEICDDGCAIKFSDPEAGLVQTDGLYSNWQGPYIGESQLIDSWGNEYFFDTDYDIDSAPGLQYGVVIGSYGPNGEGLNQYDADDIFRVLNTD